MDRTIALISLGCAKNLVNSEQMLYLLSEAGYALTPSPDGADAVIINTCGFIDAAKSEAIDTILEMAKLKSEGRLGKIIVTGCLTERYKDAVTEELPEVDAILGVGSFGEIVGAVNAVFEDKPVSIFTDNSAPVDEIPRVVSTGPAWAYIRIAEGCNNFCAFCAIPYIRGRYRSRTMENILEEAQDLARHDVKEIIVIAQDITRYGTDLYGRRCLAELCRRAPERAALPALAQAGAELVRVHEGTVLLEDIGNLVANEMFEGEHPDHDPQATAARVCEGIFALMSQCANTVVVTNQLASDGAELDEAMRAYVECVGAVSNRLAARFDTVLECVAGIPLVVKGGI